MELTSASGLHFRPAQLVVEVASRFRSEVRLRTTEQEVDAKEFLPLLTLALAKGTKVAIRASGDDAEEATAALVALVESGFDEQVAQGLGKAD